MARNCVAAFEAEGKIYAMGGITKRNNYNAIEVYDVATGVWDETLQSQMPFSGSILNYSTSIGSGFQCGLPPELERQSAYNIDGGTGKYSIKYC